MKYVALLSGGKDSCFNLLHCQKNGHELVAAASLRAGGGKEEADSYLYQTVGQDAIQLVADAIDVPLYRRTIHGTSVEQGAEYGGRTSKDGVPGDETEDLYDLLVEVKSKHPEVQAVSVGAILSNYQRVRVEHVCTRLSLTCLCYLWQRSQSDLLDEMIHCGLEAVIIKVAGIGLTPDHLGKTLSLMRPTLVKLNRLYGSHICGEGGEYESLTLDSPIFKSRIILEEVETVTHSESDIAPVAYLRVKKAYLAPKLPPPLEIALRTPLAIEDEVIQTVVNSCLNTTQRKSYNMDLPNRSVVRCSRVGPWVSVTNVQANLPQNASLEEEIIACFHTLKEQLGLHGLDLSHCATISVFLSSMSDFPTMNSVYTTFFGTSPPTRACVSVDLCPPHRVQLGCVASDNLAERQALHVQSLSYWAPANIGPYSQAVIVNDHVFISGQIGLIPATMTMPLPPSLGNEIALTTQHVERIIGMLSDKRLKWPGPMLFAIYWIKNVFDVGAVMMAHKALEEKGLLRIPTVFAAIKGLPKGALVEKQVVAHTGLCRMLDEDSEPYTVTVEGEWVSDSFELNNGNKIFIESFKVGESVRSSVIGSTSRSTLDDLHSLYSKASIHLENILQAKLFYVSDIGIQDLGLAATMIPCRSLSIRQHDDLQFVLLVECAYDV